MNILKPFHFIPFSNDVAILKNRNRFVFFLLSFLFSFFAISPVLFSQESAIATQARQETIDSYIQNAETKKLHSERYWLLLLHYRKSIFGNEKSEVDGQDFFLSTNGKWNSKDELAETIRGFFRTPTPEEVEEKVLHPMCKYPERFRWLDSHLNFDKNILPPLPCTRFNNWIAALNPTSIQVIFASFYLNNPASLFGHNLLKIGSKNPNRSEILDYAVNFAANHSPEDGSLTYAARGLFGGYPGAFSIFPYYFKINEYNDMESRDLWEYELEIGESDARRVVSHVWELGATYFDYYFLDENCSYHLLSLLEIARSDLRLREEFNLYTIPSDTVKLILEKEGFIRKKSHRPSLSSKMEQKIRELSPEERTRFYDYISSKISLKDLLNEFEGERLSRIFDAALDAKRFQKTLEKQSIDQEQEYKNLLIERSRLPFPPLPNQPPVSAPPEEGHGSGRIKLNRGASALGGYTDLSVRAAYHDFMNYDKGFVPFSTVEYFSMNLRQYDLQKNPHLEESSLIKVLSLAPVTPIQTPFSFLIDVGSDSSMIRSAYSPRNQIVFLPFLSDPTSLSVLHSVYEDKKEKRETATRVANFNTDATLGYSFSNADRENSFSWVVSFQAGGKARGNGYYREGLLVAPQIAFFGAVAYQKWKFGLTAQYFAFSIYGYLDDFKVAPMFAYALSQNWEIRLEGKLQKYYEEFQVSAAFFF
ncbi:Lnb N-terminal periplasmic domain-containing protein [Leptospira yasudae]